MNLEMVDQLQHVGVVLGLGFGKIARLGQKVQHVRIKSGV